MVVRNMEFNDPNLNRGDESRNEDEEMNEEEADGMQEAEEEDDVVISEQEYSLLDRQLDDLNSVLDALEQKNDRIHAQLRALLENSREIRQDIAMERANNEGASGLSEQDSKDEK